jgi:hypothetical protein
MNTAAQATQPKVDWTIMLYIAADDVLANFAVQSLNQLNKSTCALGPCNNANVVVAAQFAFEPSSATQHGPSRKAKRYIFKKGAAPHVTGLDDKDKVEVVEIANMSQKEALKDFMAEVYKRPDCEAEHYALILWGHGPELLLQPAAGRLTGNGDSMYLTPEELRDALEKCKPQNRSKLDIVGFDACFMSMFEMAYELKGLATYMVASQDEVPDGSFPYDSLVELFRKDGKKDLACLLNEGVRAYESTYQNFICDDDTGMRPVTLSVLDLDKCEQQEKDARVHPLADALRSLVEALLGAKGKEGLANLLIQARESSRDYAGGLYVDLYDFCENLTEQLKGTDREYKSVIQTACENVRQELRKGSTDSLILANPKDSRGHGISIYLPYLTDTQYAVVSKPLVKGEGETRGGKGFSDAINGAATEYLMFARRSLILETESYYKHLKLATDTQWYSFITELWTDVLIETAPADLDFHYSAQQSWMNLRREPIRRTSTSKQPRQILPSIARPRKVG